MNLKRGLVVVSLFAVSLPVVAADINQIQTLTQDDFHKLSQDLGAALSYKPLTPTAPLGITGFDVGIAVTATKLKNSDVLQKAGAGDRSAADDLYRLVEKDLRAIVGKRKQRFAQQQAGSTTVLTRAR